MTDWPSSLARKLICSIAALICAFVYLPTNAQVANLGFGQFKHTRWTVDDGATTGNWQIAQTPNGWIWIAARDGLWRFDGVTFEHIPAPPGSPMEHANATALEVTKSGELWVGFAQTAGVAIYRDGRLQTVPLPQTPNQIGNLSQAPDGAIWAKPFSEFRTDRLFRWYKGRWEVVDHRVRMPNGFVTGPCFTADGTAWFNFDRGFGPKQLASLRPGGERLQFHTQKVIGVDSCASDDRGRVWISDKFGMRLTAGADGKELATPTALPPLPGTDESIFFFDRKSSIWALSAAGVFYFPNAGKLGFIADLGPYRFTASEGLSSDQAHSLLFDNNDDSVWVGTELGLDKLQLSSIVRAPIDISDQSEPLFLIRVDQTIYVGGNHGVFQITPGPSRKILEDKPTGLCAARDGGFWAVVPSRIVHFRNGNRQSLTLPQGVGFAGTCAEDRFHRLWMATLDGQLMVHDGKSWRPPKRPFPRMQLRELVVTPEGDIAYTTDKDLVRIIGDEPVVTKLSQYHLGQILLVEANGRDTFVSAVNAMLRIRGTVAKRIDASRAPWVIRLKDMIQTPGGDTWMLRNQFISRVATADLERAFDDPTAPLKRTFYDHRDGFNSAQGFERLGKQMAVGSDGRVWLLSPTGVDVIDPVTLRPKPPPVPVIRSLTSGGLVRRDPSNLTLPAGTRGINIDYTALRLADPKYARFRYRLVGLDDGWIDAGDRRVASYENLAPGRYRFEVIASTDQTAWSLKSAKVDFEILPTFFQSLPFKLLCGLLAAAVLWLAFSLRLRIVAGRIRMRMAERMEERERIARELHDTLLQGFQGLMLHFQSAVNRLPRDEPVRPELDRALDRAEEVLIEGRDRVRDLRADTSDLSGALLETAEEMAAAWPATFNLTVEGKPRLLHPAAALEIRCIGEEAIRNAFHHARARLIEATLTYRSGELRFDLNDNGVGLPPEIIANGRREGHYGLIGMRERAARINAKLQIASRVNAGTQVSLTVPGSAAYGAKSGAPRWKRFARQVIGKKSRARQRHK